MTRDGLKRQVLARMTVPVGFTGVADEALDEWLSLYPSHFKFSPAFVMAGERLLRRKLTEAGRVQANREREAKIKAERLCL